MTDKPKQPPVLVLAPSKAAQLQRRGKLTGRPLRHSVTIETRYIAALTKLVNQMVAQVEREILPVLRAAQTEQSATDGSTFDADDTPKKAANKKAAATAAEKVEALQAKFSAMFKNRAHKLADGMMQAVTAESATNLNNTLTELSGKMTVGMGFMDGPVGEVVKGGIAENIALIKSIPDNYMARVSGHLEAAAMAGNNMTGLIGKIQDAAGIEKRRAKNIALDQTRKAYNTINGARMAAAGVKKFEWVHSGGGQRPRHHHITPYPAGLNGGIFELDKPPIIDPDTGERGLPGQAINCFPSYSKIKFANGCNKFYRRFYSGKLAEIVTNDGIILECTPNHPILTGDGWKPADCIQVGDYVIHAGQQGGIIGKADINNTETSIGEAFNAAAFLFGFCSKERTIPGLDFHGDGIEGDIDIVTTDRFLPYWIDASASQRVINYALALSDEVAAGFILNPERSAVSTIVRLFGATESDVRRFCSLLSFLESNEAGANNAGLRLGSYINAVVFESKPDNVSGNLESLGDSLFTDARNIEGHYFIIRQCLCAWMRSFDFWDRDTFGAHKLGEIIGIAPDDSSRLLESVPIFKKFDRVIKKHIREDFNGHIYNLENERNWYTVAGIITHNCKCTMAPVIEFEGAGNEADYTDAPIDYTGPEYAPAPVAKAAPVSAAIVPKPAVAPSAVLAQAPKAAEKVAAQVTKQQKQVTAAETLKAKHLEKLAAQVFEPLESETKKPPAPQPVKAKSKKAQKIEDLKAQIFAPLESQPAFVAASEIQARQETPRQAPPRQAKQRSKGLPPPPMRPQFSTAELDRHVDAIINSDAYHSSGIKNSLSIMDWQESDRKENFAKLQAMAKPGQILTKKEMAVVADYTGGGYDVNKIYYDQRFIKPTNPATEKLHREYKQYSDALEHSLEKMEKYKSNAPLYRGEIYSHDPERKAQRMAEIMEAHKTDKPIQFGTFLSTSRLENKAFTGDVKMIITAKGKNGVHVEPLSWNKAEDEVLFNRNSRFKVERMAKDKEGNDVVWLVEV